MKHPRIYGVQGVYKGGVTSRHVQLVSSPRRCLSIKDVIKHGIVERYGADTAHVLLRRDVVRLINPAFLCQLECGEDAYIAWKIIEAGYIYVETSELQAIHYSSPEVVLSKALRRSFGYNGIFYGIPFHVYMISTAIRFLSHLLKRRWEFLVYLTNLIGGTVSFTKTVRLERLCREGYKVHIYDYSLSFII
jgi:hypothetical protein